MVVQYHKYHLQWHSLRYLVKALHPVAAPYAVLQIRKPGEPYLS